MKKSLLVGLILVAAVIGAYAWYRTPAAPVLNDDLNEIPAEEETRNVKYRGVLEEGGISMYMEGSHRLVLEDGSDILLESDEIDLDAYVGQEVEVTGSVRPTVEEGGRIMKVFSLLQLSQASSSSSSTASLSSSAASSVASSATASSLAESSAAASSVRSVAAASSAAASSVPPAVQAEIEVRASAMAKANMDASQWTQRYCTSHIGFCFSVHKNWWFNSFGATTSSLWHVEVSNQAIVNLGEGPLVVTLESGAQGGTEPTFGTRDTQFFASVPWNATSHFEVRAPAVLQTAVEFVAQSITKLEASSSSEQAGGI